MAITTGANLPIISDTDIEVSRVQHIAKGGRPTKFNLELAAEICTRIESGETLTRICEDKHMPSRVAVNDWVRHIPAFANGYARARLNQASALADNALDILDCTETANNLTEIRSAEIRARMRFELAKVLDRSTYGNQQKITADVNMQYSVGGIIELISGKTAPLVCIGETGGQSLITNSGM